MNRRFILSPEAETDLEEIKDWVRTDGGPRVALYVIRSLPKAIRLLGRRPEAGHTRKDLTDLPLRFWPVFSYLIVYDPARRPVEVVRVLRGARSTERALSRRN